MSAPRHSFVVCTALALLFLGFAAATTPEQRYVNDSYRYTVAALHMLGHPAGSAHREALDAYCLAEATTSVRAELLRPNRLDDVAARPVSERQTECLGEHAAALEPTAPRYVAIFTPRVGYPAIAAPFVAVGGVGGMWLAATLCTALAGMLVFALLRSWDASTLGAGIGQVVLYLSPAGQWGTWALAEGPALLALTAAVVGGCWVVDRRRGGAGLLIGGLALGVAVKYSSGLIAAGLLVVAALLVAVVQRRAAAVAAAAGVTTVATLVLQRALGLPGVDTTLQDLFTLHFTEPDVPDPWPLWWVQTGHFWAQWIPDNALLLASAAAALWAVGRVRAPLIAVPLLAGLAAQAALPSASQADRLYTLAWLTVAIGLPVLLAAVRPARPGHAASNASMRRIRTSTVSAS